MGSASNGRYLAVVFEQVPPTEDFSCSREVVLPGKHTADVAWAVLRAALDGPDGATYIGGEVRPFCGNRCGTGCGKPLLI